MNVKVTGRNFTLTAADEAWINSRIETALDLEESLRVTAINVVIAREKSRFTSDIVVTCKYHVYSSSVEDFEFHTSFDAALNKVAVQLAKLREKIREHQAEPIRNAEPKPADVE